MSQDTAKPAAKRILSIDVLRGITIAGMILVNNPGDWSHTFAPLHHAEWSGLTPTDLVFPFFIFIMGVSIFISLRKFDFKFSNQTFLKIIRRTLAIFFLGWALDWIAITWSRLQFDHKPLIDAINNFDRIRYLGVLQRLAICYCVTALLAIFVNRRAMFWIIIGLLVSYTALLFVGNGLAFNEENIIGVIDRAILGPEHMYGDTVDGVHMKFDPEGLVSTIPAIAHCIIGFLCGALLLKSEDNLKRSWSMLVVGALLTVAGLLLDYGMPINKKIWSPTYVLTTCGLAATTLGLLIWIIDIKHFSRWSNFFKVFGVNPLFIYAFSTLLAVVMRMIRFNPTAANPRGDAIQWLFSQNVLLPLSLNDPYVASLLYALSFLLLNWLIGLFLYRHRLFIKI